MEQWPADCQEACFCGEMQGKSFQSGPGKAARPLILFAEVIKSFFSPRGPVHCDHSLMLALNN